MWGERSLHKSFGWQMKCIRGLMFVLLLKCSWKFIIHIDMFHLGMYWDNMAYDKLVTQFKIIMGYIHHFDYVWFIVQPLENIFPSAYRWCPITCFSTWLNHLPLNRSPYSIVVNILSIKVFIFQHSCNKQWSFDAIIFFHYPRQDWSVQHPSPHSITPCKKNCFRET